MVIKFHSLEMDVRTVVERDEQYILITPLKTGRKMPLLIIEACLLWGKEGSGSKYGQRLSGECNGRRFEIFTNGNPTQTPHAASLSPSISVLLDQPLVISTRPCTIEEAETLYQK